MKTRYQHPRCRLTSRAPAGPYRRCPYCQRKHRAPLTLGEILDQRREPTSAATAQKPRQTAQEQEGLPGKDTSRNPTSEQVTMTTNEAFAASF